jgi:archaetidylinositol phosphate synthase
MVVLELRELGDTVHERDRRQEPLELELALECAVHLTPSVRRSHRRSMPVYHRPPVDPPNPSRPSLATSRKLRPSFEVLCELLYRPLAHLVVRALLPLRVPPPAVVLAATATGLAAATELWRGHLVLAAILLQVKTVLDNADGQLARLSGRVTAFGRYLDSESDLVVNAAIFVALGTQIGPWLAAAGFVTLTLVLSVNYNVERLYRRERGERAAAMPEAQGAAAVLARVYAAVYAPQDRLVEGYEAWRLRRRSPEARLAWHDFATVAVIANLGLSPQLATLGVCLALGHPAAYVFVLFGQALLIVALALRREVLAARASSQLAVIVD